jgi:serine/threonine protein kinase
MPETIAKYRITRQLGRGRNGAVYLGFDPFIKRNVAIKLATGGAMTVCAATAPWYEVRRDGSVDFGAPREDPRGTSAATHALLAEAHVLNRLKHPNILYMFDAGVEGVNPFIVTEYIEGARSLKDFCVPHNLMPVEIALNVVRKCAVALEFSHSKGVVHGSVRPENVLLTPDFNVKLKGFSSAPPSKSDENALDAFRYASPETARDGEMTARSDVFSLGAVLYELLTGSPPFEANNLMSLLYLIAGEEPPPPGTRRPQVPDFVDEITAKAMNKKIAQRYTACGEFAEALAHALERIEDTPRKTTLETPPAKRGATPGVKGDAIPSVKGDATSGLKGDATSVARAAMLEKLAFFEAFTPREIDELVRAGGWLEYGDGDAMSSAREAGNSFCVIVRGRAAVRKDGRAIGALKEGECFAEAGGEAGARVSARVFSEGGSLVLKLTTPALEENTSPECRFRFTRAFLHAVLEKYPLIV